MSDVVMDLQVMKATIQQLKETIKQSLETNKIKERCENVRTYIKYNERLSHCESESFSTRSYFESDLSDAVGGMEETIETIDYLIDEVNELLGRDDDEN